ncbi:hypothetical protein PS624_06027 [Pseudomonas fluorescens]|uniref:Uncharacterized protein n=1 Tax=Pseudomonas fluorescens TaxID=294 RepID=A0A5E6Y4M2_PSEFL|nr:hypothetical protein PS624_06027 [Pseudomonas fluorescens]
MVKKGKRRWLMAVTLRQGAAILALAKYWRAEGAALQPFAAVRRPGKPAPTGITAVLKPNFDKRR